MEFFHIKSCNGVEIQVGGDYELSIGGTTFPCIRVQRIFIVDGDYFVEGNLWRSDEELRLPRGVQRDKNLVFFTAYLFKARVDKLVKRITVVPKEMYKELPSSKFFANFFFTSHIIPYKARMKILPKDFAFSNNKEFFSAQVCLNVRRIIQKQLKKLNGFKGRLTIKECESYDTLLDLATKWGKVLDGNCTTTVIVQENRSKIDEFLGAGWDYFLLSQDRFKFISELSVTFNKRTKNISFSFLYFFSELKFSNNYREKCFLFEMNK